MARGPDRQVTLLVGASLLPSLAALGLIPDAQARDSILISLFVSYLGYLATKALIPTLQRFTLKAGLSGLDINKRGTPAGEKRIPESLGLASGVVFLVRRRLGGRGWDRVDVAATDLCRSQTCMNMRLQRQHRGETSALAPFLHKP